MVTGIMACNVYVDDFERAARFYGEVLGLRRGGSMGETSCFFEIGANKYGLFLDGGYKPARAAEEHSHAAFTLHVESAQALFDRLKSAGAEILADAPKDMGRGYFWFQFRDPAGNILEAISGPT